MKACNRSVISCCTRDKEKGDRDKVANTKTGFYAIISERAYVLFVSLWAKRNIICDCF